MVATALYRLKIWKSYQRKSPLSAMNNRFSPVLWLFQMTSSSALQIRKTTPEWKLNFPSATALKQRPAAALHREALHILYMCINIWFEYTRRGKLLYQVMLDEDRFIATIHTHEHLQNVMPVIETAKCLSNSHFRSILLFSSSLYSSAVQDGVCEPHGAPLSLWAC